ncbi:MAG: CRISPR-associated protein Cas4 [Anaerolineaceae bacterium]|nr:CRISPR-associated protein Cas4 [Anaerolineaceae bacterium]
MEYSSDELLQLSGLQHFLFCRRQWALIHIEQQWKENFLTAEGREMHSAADDPFFNEKRKGLITSRSVPVVSYRLGLSGICDLVEFSQADHGVKLPGRRETYLPIPVEYKHGQPKKGLEDEIQLIAQCLCLEEMFSFSLQYGFLFYGKTRRRLQVNITQELRELVWQMSKEMHEMYKKRFTPKVKTSKACASCSLKEICLPELQKTKTVREYIHTSIYEEDI